MTFPAKWDDIKHGSTYNVEGTRDHDIHPDEDNIFDNVHHTHCSECDIAFELTHHFWGDGIICQLCIDKKYPDFEKEIREVFP